LTLADRMKTIILTALSVAVVLLSGCTIGPSRAPRQADLDRHSTLVTEIAALERAHLKWIENPNTHTPEQRSRYVIHLEARLREKLMELHDLEQRMEQERQPTTPPTVPESARERTDSVR